jgi:hypothetical protein
MGEHGKLGKEAMEQKVFPLMGLPALSKLD